MVAKKKKKVFFEINYYLVKFFIKKELSIKLNSTMQRKINKSLSLLSAGPTGHPAHGS